MSEYIEVHLRMQTPHDPVTLAVAHISAVGKTTISGRQADERAWIHVGGARLEVTESYEEIRKMMGVGVLRCGEMHEGRICDQRLEDDNTYCPIHGMVGA